MKAIGFASSPEVTRSTESQHTAAGAAWDRKDAADAWKGTSGRTLAWLGQNLGGCGLEAPMFFKPKFIAIALRRT